MKRIILLLLVGILTISATGCLSLNLNANTCIPLADAPSDIEDIIMKLSTDTVGALENNNPDAIMEIASKEFKQNQSLSELSEVMLQMKERIPGNYSLLDAFYIKFANITDSPMVFTAGDISSPDYYFSVTSFAKEMAVLFYTSKQGALTYILAINFVYEEGVWKLNGFTADSFAVNGKNAPELFEQASILLERGESVSAALYAQVLNAILSPANTITYPNSQEMVDFINEATTMANSEYTFPITVDTDDGSFTVVSIQGSAYEEGIACIIRYVSPTPIGEENELIFKSEGQAILDELFSLMTGIEDNFNVYVLRAFEEMPYDENKEYVSYSTVYVE